MEALFNLVHAHHVAGKAVAFGADYLVELHFIVGSIGHALAHVAGPSAGTACTSCRSEGDGVLTAQHADALEALLGDDVACEDVVILLQVVAHVGDEFLDTLHEVGMDVGLHTSDGVIVQDEASAAGLLKDVEHLLAVAETIEEGCRGTQVLAEAGEEQDVRVDTLQLVHDGADVLHAAAHLHAHGLLDAHAQRVAVLHGAQVVQTVGQGQCLRVGQAFVHLLDAAVDVSAVHVNLVDVLALERYSEAQHAVRGRVLGADVHYIFVVAEKHRPFFGRLAVLCGLYFEGGVHGLFVGHAQGVLLLWVVILAQGIAYPVVAEKEASHVGMSHKADAEEVVYFAFRKFGSAPDVGYRRQFGLLAIEGRGFYHYALTVFGRF